MRDEFIAEGGIPILIDLLHSGATNIITSGTPLLFLLARDPTTHEILLGEDNDVIRLAVALLEFPDRTGILVAFSVLEIFLREASGAETFAQIGGITKLLSYAFSGEITFIRKSLNLFCLISGHGGCRVAGFRYYLQFL